MGWFRVDDKFPHHPKVEAMETQFRSSFSDAIMLWTFMGADCAGRETDGVFTAKRMEMVVPLTQKKLRAAVHALVSVRLLFPTEHGYSFHQWEERNPTKAKLEIQRGLKNARQDRWKQGKSDDGDASGDASQDVSGDADRDAPVDAARDGGGDASQDASRVRAGARVIARSHPLPSHPRRDLSGGSDLGTGRARATGQDHPSHPESETTTTDTSEPESEWGQREAWLWREWRRAFERARSGQIAADRHGTDKREAVRVLSEQADRDGVAFEDLGRAVLAAYWAEPWPRAPKSQPSIRNLLGQLDRLVAAVRAPAPQSGDDDLAAMASNNERLAAENRGMSVSEYREWRQSVSAGGAA